MKLPLLSSRKLCRFLEAQKFICLRQRGSHRIYRHQDGRQTVVPMHSNKPIKRSLLLAILKQIRISRKEFLRKTR